MKSLRELMNEIDDDKDAVDTINIKNIGFKTLEKELNNLLGFNGKWEWSMEPGMSKRYLWLKPFSIPKNQLKMFKDVLDVDIQMTGHSEIKIVNQKEFYSFVLSYVIHFNKSEYRVVDFAFCDYDIEDKKWSINNKKI